jgi:PEP-CTERM motif
VKYSRRARRHIKGRSGFVAAAIRSIAFLLLVVACVFILRWVSDRSGSYPPQRGVPLSSRAFEFSAPAPPYEIQSRNRRLVYPYSVIPGGVRSAGELREIAKHDPVVAAHYSGFDYDRARVIEVDHPRLVYVSYRKAGKIHWTSKQATLRAGEVLLTDGRITARTRCGNQVSVLPQADVLPEEPTMAELERPDAFASGSEQLFPQSSVLLHLDPLIPIGPLYAGFPTPGTFIPLPIGGGGVGPVSGASCPPQTKGTTTAQSKKDCNTKSPLPPSVPEPGTMVLMASGAAAIYARYRSRKT